MKRLLAFVEKNPTIVLAIVGAGAAYYVYNKGSNAVGEIFDYTKGKASTLAQGLSNPIDALTALIKPPVFPSATALTQNFQNYIDLNGGIDAYLAAHRNGTFRGAPYNSSTTYPSKKTATIKSPFSFLTI